MRRLGELALRLFGLLLLGAALGIAATKACLTSSGVGGFAGLSAEGAGRADAIFF